MNCRKKKKDATAVEDNERFLEHKGNKTSEDAKSDQKVSFMVGATSLYITWGGNDKYWIWNTFKDTSDEKTEVAKLSYVSWLDVKGTFKMSDLSPGTLYEVVYEVKLTKVASGWHLPVNLRLSLPDGRVQERQVNLSQEPKEKWIELNVGNFRTEENGKTSSETGEASFDLYEHGSHRKRGLLISGAILRPKS